LSAERSKALQIVNRQSSIRQSSILMIRLARTIHFNAGRTLWRANWRPEKNRSVYGEEGAHGYGHNYELEVAVEGEIDPESSMVINLTDLDRILKEEVDAPLDHKNLNRDVPDFANLPPTAENLAAWIWRRVGVRLAQENWPCRLAHLRLRLTPGFAVEIEAEQPR
jgi:6-pyruvoyltetrahydropterin/6-carboxytetrahydropterin synthase